MYSAIKSNSAPLALLAMAVMVITIQLYAWLDVEPLAPVEADYRAALCNLAPVQGKYMTCGE